MLKKTRILLAAIFWLGITLLFLDGSGLFPKWLGWMPKLQFLPAVMALNFIVIAGLIVLTLVFGRIYCSVICPLGVYQDGVAHISVALKRRRKNRKPYSYSKEVKWLRYGVWTLFVLAIIFGIQTFVASLAPYSAYGRIVTSVIPHKAWLWSLPTFCVAVTTLAIVSYLAWKNGRTYCNTVCPVGTTLSFFSRFALFRPVIDSEKCRNCHICEHNCKAACIDIATHSIDYSRCVDCFNCLEDCKFGALRYRFVPRAKASGAAEEKPSSSTRSGRGPISSGGPGPGEPEQNGLRGHLAGRDPGKKNGPRPENDSRRAFLAGSAIALTAVTLRAQGKKVDGGFATVVPKESPQRDAPLTPPGSKSIRDFYSKCTACQLCVSACPNNVLRPSTDLEHLMQPLMGYENGWCRPECTRCSEVCPSGAIIKISREEKTQYHIGTARINRNLCVAENGTRCGNCARRCPTGAITMIEDETRGVSVPSVDEAVCIGCGACEFLCPSRPVSAISVNGRYVHLDTELS